MAKKSNRCYASWFGPLVVLVGLWFVLEDLAVVSTGISLWPIVIALLGIKIWSCNKSR